MKKRLGLSAWLVKDNGEQENVTERFNEDLLQQFITDIIRGEQIRLPNNWFLPHAHRFDYILTSAAVLGDGVMQLYIYETENAYLKSKENRYEGSVGRFFNF